MATSTQSIREIVNNQSSAAVILQRFDFDLCAQAELPLARACAEMQLSVDQVLEKLIDAALSEPGARVFDPASFSNARLMRHIVRVHHRRVRQELPGLVVMAEELASKRSNRTPELGQVAELVSELRDDLLAHIEEEEQILFPHIAQMEESNSNGLQAKAWFRSVTQPISIMMREHDDAVYLFAELRKITHDFALPAWACATHAALFAGLREIEADLQTHAHLEDDVLFPRAIEMEAESSFRR